MIPRRRGLFLLLAGGFALLTVWYLDRHPPLLPGWPKDAEQAGQAPGPRDHGDVLLMLGPARPEPAANLDALDASAAWTNLLEAEFGAYSLARVEPDRPVGLQPCRVVSASAHDQLDLGELESFIQNGGVAFLDAPSRPGDWAPGLLALAGLEQDGESPFPPSSLLPALALDAIDRDAFDASPFPRPERISKLSPTKGGATPLNGSSPALFFERRLGAGKLVTAAFSVANLYLRMLQGIPEQDFSLTERHGDYPGMIEPDDLVKDPALRENETPFADLLARAVGALLDPPDLSVPGLPRLLWYPQGSSGLFLMTHDEDFRGGAELLRLLEDGRELGLKPTVFIIAHPRVAEDWSQDDLLQVGRSGGAFGLHWNQLPMPEGLGPIEPIRRRQDLESQWNRLSSLAGPSASIRSNRNHYLVLQDGWTTSMRKLAAIGVRLDSTFGANKGRGYLFGSARPYRILDQNGQPLAIRELPFINQEDWGAADQHYFTRLLRANAQRHHGALVSLFHSHLIVRTEAGRQLFKEAARIALSTGHLPMNFDELLEFWDARQRARIRSVRTATEWICRIEVDRDDFQLALPEAPSELLARARLDGRPLSSSRTRLGARECAVIPLQSGVHELKIRLQ